MSRHGAMEVHEMQEKLELCKAWAILDAPIAACTFQMGLQRHGSSCKKPLLFMKTFRLVLMMLKDTPTQMLHCDGRIMKSSESLCVEKSPGILRCDDISRGDTVLGREGLPHLIPLGV